LAYLYRVGIGFREAAANNELVCHSDIDAWRKARKLQYSLVDQADVELLLISIKVIIEDAYLLTIY